MADSADTTAASESVTVGFDPHIAGIRDVDLEAVEILQLMVSVVAEPGKESVGDEFTTCRNVQFAVHYFGFSEQTVRAAHNEA